MPNKLPRRCEAFGSNRDTPKSVAVSSGILFANPALCLTAFSRLSRIAFQRPLAAKGAYLEGFAWRIARVIKRGEIVKSAISEGASGVRQASLPGDCRIGRVGAIPDVLLALGVSPQEIFTRAGVRLGSFSNPETRIAFEALGRLLLASAAATRREDFGLLVGARFRLQDLGLLGELMRHSPTVGDALRALLMHLQVYDRGAVPMLLHQELSNVLLGYSILIVLLRRRGSLR